jgi:glycerol-3-phosphate O-acyltransferase
VFTEYVRQLFAHVAWLEYFIEGGRRAPPFARARGGMLAMTLKSSRESRRPVVFQPVYMATKN